MPQTRFDSHTQREQVIPIGHASYTLDLTATLRCRHCGMWEVWTGHGTSQTALREAERQFGDIHRRCAAAAKEQELNANEMQQRGYFGDA